MEPAIALKNISKSFQKNPSYPWLKSVRVQALKDVTLSVPQGHILALVGSNGAGKTTLLRIISTIVLPDSGDGRVNGFALSHSQQIRKTLSVAMGEERGFYGRLTVWQNLEFFCHLYDLRGKALTHKINDLAERFELQELLHQPYERLSTGTRQRVVLARCLLNNAKLLLADEPTRSLDADNKKKVSDWLRKMSRDFGQTIVFTTHDRQEAERSADSIATLKEGTIQIKGAHE
jgi:ABC-2 type transport system ATP-binding protein